MTEPQVHGGLDVGELERLNLEIDHLIDFSVNSNPYGPFPQVVEIIKNIPVCRYPDREVLPLCRLLAEANKVKIDEIVAGNGTAEIIWLVCQALLNNKKVLILGPTFGEYERAARAVGAEVIVKIPAQPESGWNVEMILEQLQQVKPQAVFLCNPNNPTGSFISVDGISLICRSLQEIGGWLILDEAYRTFLWGSPFMKYHEKNLIILRSMTKDFAMAGLRLGYAISDHTVIEKIKTIQPPWSVNIAAQAAGEAVLKDMDYLYWSISETRKNSKNLQNTLKDMGYRVVDSELHYFLVNVFPFTGMQFRKRLMENGLIVRDCASFGLKEYIRIGTQLPQQNRYLIETMAHIKNKQR